MTDKFLNKRKGFTLIELLVVISIIGLLAALGTARYIQAEKNARDVRRKSDLNQYRIALENYANVNNTIYPDKSNGPISVLCESGNFANEFLAGGCIQDVLKDDASHGDYVYFSNPAGTDYVIGAKMEVEKSGKNLYEVCSNGRSGYVSTFSTNGACNL